MDDYLFQKENRYYIVKKIRQYFDKINIKWGQMETGPLDMTP